MVATIGERVTCNYKIGMNASRKITERRLKWNGGVTRREE